MIEVVETANEYAGVYFRTICLPLAGLRVPQHKHPYAHPTLCLSGRARHFVDGIAVSIIEEREIVEVQANRLHEFESLVPNTRLMCITPADLAEHDKAIPLSAAKFKELESA